jgi:hypothetical protein
VPGRGLINVYTSFLNDLRGEIIVERFPWDQAVLGPHEKEDLSDCEGLFKHRMYSLAKLTQLWGDKAKEIDKDFRMYQELTPEQRHVTYSHDQYAHSDNKYFAPMQVNDDAMVDIAKKEYRVLECWRVKYVNVPVAVNSDDDAFINCFGWDKKDLEAIKFCQQKHLDFLSLSFVRNKKDIDYVRKKIDNKKIITNWASGYESLLLSSTKNKNDSRIVLITDSVALYSYFWDNDSNYLSNHSVFRPSQIPNNLFHLKRARYIFTE